MLKNLECLRTGLMVSNPAPSFRIQKSGKVQKYSEICGVSLRGWKVRAMPEIASYVIRAKEKL